MGDIVVIGAGMGGLAAAVALAVAGHRVTVAELGDGPGGKVGSATVDGVRFDTGPSVLTLPEVLGEVFERAGTSLDDELDLIAHDRLCRYLWPDGASLDIAHRPSDTLQCVGRAFGPEAACEFEAFLGYARQIWEAAAPNFIFGRAPTMGSVLKLGLRSFGDVRAIDPLRTMDAGIDRHISHPKLRDLLRRYATYNGSDPRKAPATLNCIAWVELGMGCFGVRGGMSAMATGLEAVARRIGVDFRYATRVTGVEAAGGRVTGVETASGRMGCDAVVANADVAHLAGDLLPDGLQGRLDSPAEPSMSGWTAVLRARRRPVEARPPHTVLFPDDYAAEFVDIFNRDRPPADPMVYVCAQEKAHATAGWPDHEPLFVMANAPAQPTTGPRNSEVWSALRSRALGRLVDAGLIEPDDAVVWERSPAELADRFPGSRGSIYGAASNSQTAAFRRPANRVVGIDGLYLASGSAHPGGGVPLCLQSGLTAADALNDDFGGSFI